MNSPIPTYVLRSVEDDHCPICGEPCKFRRESLDAMSAYYAGKSSAVLSNCCDGELKNPKPEYWDLP